MNDDDLTPMEDAGPVDAPAIDETPLDATEAPPPSVDDIAAKMGWSPKENWRGDPGKWKPAHEFVAATADINNKVTTELKSVKDQLANIARTNAAMLEKALEGQRAELMAARKEAFDFGDYDKMTAVEQELQQLQAAPAAKPPAPEAQAFVEQHSSWWGKDQEATSWAINRAEQLKREGFGDARQVAIVGRELANYFPEYAPQPAPPKPKPVALSQPGNRGASPRGKSFADLPAEAQKAAKDFAASGKVTLEQYASSYFQSQEA